MCCRLEECLKFSESDGFVGLWETSKDLSLTAVKNLLEKLSVLENYNKEDNVDLTSYKHLLDSTQETCSRLLEENVLSESDFQDITTSMGKAIHKDFSCRDTLYSAEILIHECNSLLSNLFYEEKFCKHCLFSIVKTYFEVCLKVTQWIQTHDQFHAEAFYTKALDFSNFIVSEESCHQLYSLLEWDDLEVILQQVNQVMKCRLEINPNALNN